MRFLRRRSHGLFLSALLCFHKTPSLGRDSVEQSVREQCLTIHVDLVEFDEHMKDQEDVVDRNRSCIHC